MTQFKTFPSASPLKFWVVFGLTLHKSATFCWHVCLRDNGISTNFAFERAKSFDKSSNIVSGTVTQNCARVDWGKPFSIGGESVTVNSNKTEWQRKKWKKKFAFSMSEREVCLVLQHVSLCRMFVLVASHFSPSQFQPIHQPDGDTQQSALDSCAEWEGGKKKKIWPTSRDEIRCAKDGNTKKTTESKKKESLDQTSPSYRLTFDQPILILSIRSCCPYIASIPIGTSRSRVGWHFGNHYKRKANNRIVPFVRSSFAGGWFDWCQTRSHSLAQSHSIESSRVESSRADQSLVSDTNGRYVLTWIRTCRLKWARGSKKSNDRSIGGVDTRNHHWLGERHWDYNGQTHGHTHTHTHIHGCVSPYLSLLFRIVPEFGADTENYSIEQRMTVNLTFLVKWFAR